MDPWLEGLVVDKMVQSVTTSMEAAHRAAREELKKFDEVMEQFRKHTYSLRRLILSGTHAQNMDMLRFYFQVDSHQHDHHSAAIITSIAIISAAWPSQLCWNFFFLGTQA